VVILRRGPERRAPAVVSVDRRATPDQQLGHRRVPVLRGDVERRDPFCGTGAARLKLACLRPRSPQQASRRMQCGRPRPT
jgi:hypothetical protein